MAGYDNSGTLLRSYIHGPGIDEPIQYTVYSTQDSVYYYLSDGLGSIVEIQDDTGATVESYRYDAFGNPTIFNAEGTEIPSSSINNPYLFTAREYDKETGLYFYRARYCDSSTGRFLSEDPIQKVYMYKNNFYFYVSFLMFFPESLNGYVYVTNNPLNIIDPGGLAPQTPGCDGVPDWIEKRYKSTKGCCDEHDDCYIENNCSMQSWFEKIDPEATKNCDADKSEDCARCNARVLTCFMSGG